MGSESLIFWEGREEEREGKGEKKDDGRWGRRTEGTGRNLGRRRGAERRKGEERLQRDRKDGEKGKGKEEDGKRGVEAKGGEW